MGERRSVEGKMMDESSIAWVEVDLAAYRHNLREVARHTGTRVLAVVKANGYGHGMVPVARAAVEAGAAFLGVATVGEGVRLREARVGEAQGRLPIPILVMGAALEGQVEAVASRGLAQAVSRPELVRALDATAARRGVRVPVHVKVDTGMARVGVAPGEALLFCRWVSRQPHLQLQGVMTHFATSDEPDICYSMGQLRVFRELVPALRAEFGPELLLHTANSGAIARMPDSWLDMVRPGLVSYGIPPSPEPTPLDLRPCLTLRGRITQVREFPAGQRVSYSGLFTTQRPSLLGTLPIGYADGYRRALSNRGEALVRGHRAPIRGRVCMDQMVLDLTDIRGAAVGDVATLIGADGEDRITAWELGEAIPTIVDEVLVGLGERLPRVYDDTMT
jgi:alanine racemase